MGADQTPLDVEAIRARLDATSPGMTVDVHDGGSTLRATGNATDRPGFVGAVTGLVGALGGETGQLRLTFADDEDGQDATFALHAAADIRDLLDENARLNAKVDSLIAHNGVLVTEIRFQADRAERMRVERDRAINECDDWETKYAELSVERDALRRALDAAPEMPRPPAEEAQERPETAGTGSGRGTGVAEASETTQDGEDA